MYSNGSSFLNRFDWLILSEFYCLFMPANCIKKGRYEIESQIYRIIVLNSIKIINIVKHCVVLHKQMQL